MSLGVFSSLPLLGVHGVRPVLLTPSCTGGPLVDKRCLVVAARFPLSSPPNSAFNRIPGRQYEIRRPRSHASAVSQNLDAVTAGKHQVEHDQVEPLGVHAKEAILARSGDDALV